MRRYSRRKRSASLTVLSESCVASTASAQASKSGDNRSGLGLAVGLGANAGELRVAGCCQGLRSAWHAGDGNGGPVRRESAKTTRPRGPPLRAQSATRAAVVTITRTITVAAGVFAPGHLGGLTAIVPFELADAVLEETRTCERRLRMLPSRVGLYFVLAMCLFPRAGYLGVWAELTAALDGLGLAVPSGRALRDLRRRLGPAPFRSLFEVLAGPLGQPSTPGSGSAGTGRWPLTAASRSRCPIRRGTGRGWGS